MDTISRSAANAPVHAARPSERVKPVPHSAKDRLERQDENHGRRGGDRRHAAPSAGPADSPEPVTHPPATAAPLPPPPAVRPPAAPGSTAESLEDGVENIRRLMEDSDPKVDLQR